MTVSSTDRYPQVVKISSHDWSANLPNVSGWASYGRLCVLRQLLVSRPNACVDLANDGEVRFMANSLGLTPRRFLQWVDQELVPSGIADAGLYTERRWLTVDDLMDQVVAYQSAVAASRRNGAKGGRPPKAAPT